MIELDSVHHMEALGLMAQLPDQSVDAIITDLPYGTTACSWDTIIPLEPMWAGVKRVLKPRGAFVTTSLQPFTTDLINSARDLFKYEWIWKKSMPVGFIHAQNKPLKMHETILVFSQGVTVHANQSFNRMHYYPQFTDGEHYRKVHRSVNMGRAQGHSPTASNYDAVGRVSETDKRYPNSILEFSNGNHHTDHPTQKPIALYEYLIKTYTLPGEVVLDFCCGSGTTAIAARNTGRRFIVGDFTAEYVEITRKRLAEPYTPLLFTDEPLPEVKHTQEPLL